MPDYTYHPFFKPLLFRLPVEASRKLTLGLLEVQARTALGRRVFRLFGHGLPPDELAVELFGLRFPGPIGLGPGIDVEGSAASVLQLLGFGFMVAGPARALALAGPRAARPLRRVSEGTLVRSPRFGGPAVREVCARLRAMPGLRIPCGVALEGESLEEAVAAADADFVEVSGSPDFRRLRAATRRPLLLRLDPEGDPEAAARAAMDAGWDGCVATAGARSPLLEDGEADGPFLTRRSRELVARLARAGVPVIGAGGVMTPEDATALLDAGARLVELHAGLVFAGPGLPGRILHVLERPSPPPAPPPPAGPPRRSAWGPLLSALTGLALAGSGLFALYLAATVKLLPHDVAYLGMTVEELCGRNQCRIVHFMAHDRVAFGGSILSIGFLYIWLGLGPLARGEAWSWWTLLLSGGLGFASFLTYLGTGYLDVWHGWATLALLPCWALGLAAAWPRLSRPRGPDVLKRPGAPAWLWSPAGQGRALLIFTAIGMILGGLTIMAVGMTAVFVPQDLEYMGITAAELQAINERLVPLIAHDRAGFGGGLSAGGLAILLAAWCGFRPGDRVLWWVFLAAGLVGFGTSIGVHAVVGYMDFVHLLPAYVGALAFLAGIARLRRPVLGRDGPAFPDFAWPTPADSTLPPQAGSRRGCR